MERRLRCGIAEPNPTAPLALRGAPEAALRRGGNEAAVTWQNHLVPRFCLRRETSADFFRKGGSGGGFRLHGSLVSRGPSGYTTAVTTDLSIAALTRLQEGNKRFIANVRGIDALLTQQRRAELATRQQPFAIVLGCSDSRAPAEIVFDQGLGDLFVIRIAGNIVAPSGIASVEFAAQRFGIPLVVLMGHTGCGAIEAALESISRPDDVSLHNLRSIVDRVKPAIEPLMMTDLARDPVALRRQCVRANVRAGANHLRHGSPVLEGLVLEGRLAVVGAEYDLESGLVDFFDGVPTR
jgi:carbonic anhydrase